MPLPAGAQFTVSGDTIAAKGPLGRVERSFPASSIAFSREGDAAVLTLRIPANRRRNVALLRTWERHVANLAAGVTVGFVARMKIVAAHFPMKVQAKDGSVLIENFLGEKYPRSAALVPGVTATVDGEFVSLSGPDIEWVGQSAANIERATHIRDYDPRVFQDGIYLIERARPKEAA